jgi:carboxylesterase type B
MVERVRYSLPTHTFSNTDKDSPGNVPFKRAILQSGSPAADPGVSGNGTITSTSTVARLAGCTSSNSQTVLSCLRSLPYPKLLAAVIKYENQTATAGSYQDIFYPAIDNAYIPDAPSTLLRTGRFHHNISVMASWTYNDGSIFTNQSLASADDVTLYLKQAYPSLNTSTITHLTSTLYPIQPFLSQATSLSAPSAYVLQAAQIYRDINFACPAIDTVHHVTFYSSPQTPTYLYEMNTTSFGLLLTASNASYLGVIHTSDILFAFNNANLNGFLPITPAQNVTQRKMSGSFARFASFGSPSGGNNRENALQGWKEAFERPVRRGQTVRRASVRVIGGESAGQKTLTLSSGGGGGGFGPERRLLERCAYINSVEVQGQVLT